MLILGDPGGVGDALVIQLQACGTPGVRSQADSDAAVRDLLLEPRWRAVAIVSHDDVLVLRLALLCAHLRPDLPVWATLFDRTIAHQLHETVPGVRTVNSAELVASQLADQCCAVAGVPGAGWRSGVRVVDDALRLLVAASLGLVAVLILQTVTSIVALHESVVDAIYFGTRELATIADAPGAAVAPVWWKLVSTATSVIAVVLIAVLTAAIVRRLSRPRLTTLAGRRRCPATGHVLLVGLGQVGFRLAQALTKRGFGVVAIERGADAPCVRLAPDAGIPVAIGRGDDRRVLERCGVRRCAVVAAVTSDDLMNVAVGLAVKELAPQTPLVLRLGDGEVVSETDSLLHLGRVVDVHELAAGRLATEIAGVRVGDATPVS